MQFNRRIALWVTSLLFIAAHATWPDAAVKGQSTTPFVDVTAQSGESFKSQNFGKGGTFSFTPTKAGTIKYVCTIHPGMDGTLTVVK